MKNVYAYKIKEERQLLQIYEIVVSEENITGYERERLVYFLVQWIQGQRRLGLEKLGERQKIFKRYIENFISINFKIFSDRFFSYISYFKNINLYMYNSLNHL